MILFICMSVCACMCAKNIRFKFDYNFKDPFEYLLSKIDIF